MRYYFEGKIQVKDEEGYIDIPFNIWEVCKQRDVIKAVISIDDVSIACELLPIEKGDYRIHLDAQAMAQIAPKEMYHILLYVTGSLIKMDSHSPYSLEHPIRRLDHIDLIRQQNDGLCGQAVVAMLAGTTIEEVIEVMQCKEWQGTMGRVISAVNYYGIAHSDIIYYTQGASGVELPKCCILMERMGRFSHYLLHFDGKFYDPTLGMVENYDVTKLVGYLEIKC